MCSDALQFYYKARVALRLSSSALYFLHDTRRLGIPPDASFEEVQDARNFLYEVSLVEHF
jgi:hypothetical protein